MERTIRRGINRVHFTCCMHKGMAMAAMCRCRVKIASYETFLVLEREDKRLQA